MNCVSLDQLRISLDNLFVMISPTVNVADCPVESIPPLVLRKSSFILKVHPIQGLETFYGLQINRMARKDTFNQRGRVRFDRVWMDVVYTRQNIFQVI